MAPEGALDPRAREQLKGASLHRPTVDHLTWVHGIRHADLLLWIRLEARVSGNAPLDGLGNVPRNSGGERGADSEQAGVFVLWCAVLLVEGTQLA